MNAKQILEQMLSFSVAQHGVKDQIIEDLQKESTELKKKLAQYETPETKVN